MLSIHVPPIRQTESAGLRCRFMGHTHVTVTFRNPRHPERQWQGLCLVDTEATDCLIPAEAVEALGLAPRGEVTVVLANEQETRLLFAGAEIEFMGEVTFGRALFGPAGAEPLLGVVALESVGIVVDPTTRQLRRLPALLLKHGSGSRRASARQ
jgi:clan AA aspartic protease